MRQRRFPQSTKGPVRAPVLLNEKRKRACKPGSVIDGHLSRPCVAAWLQPPPLGRPGRPKVPIHGVAPDRVYSVGLSPGDGRALISAFPPLPRRGRGGISLLHLSEGHPWRALPVILALWSPDFPHAQAFALCPRPSGPLAQTFYPYCPSPSSYYCNCRRERI